MVIVLTVNITLCHLQMGCNVLHLSVVRGKGYLEMELALIVSNIREVSSLEGFASLITVIVCKELQRKGNVRIVGFILKCLKDTNANLRVVVQANS